MGSEGYSSKEEGI